MRCNVCKKEIHLGSISTSWNLTCCNECFDLLASYKGILNLQKKKEILKQRRKSCEDCGNILELEAHHIIARLDGGKNTFGNLKILCKKCHKLKKNKGG